LMKFNLPTFFLFPGLLAQEIIAQTKCCDAPLVFF
jgi:hypothetical protein